MSKKGQTLLLVLALIGTESAICDDLVRTVALSREQAPGVPGGINFQSFGTPRLDSEGSVVFTGELTGPQINATGLWRKSRNDTLTLVAREGDLIPGDDMSLMYGAFDSVVFTLVSRTLVFATTPTSQTEVISGRSRQVFKYYGKGENTLLIQTGDRAVGTSEDVTFDGFIDHRLDSTGRAAFIGILAGPSINESNNLGIWRENGGSSLKLVVREGNSAPGTPEGTTFGKLHGGISHANGSTAFIATVAGPSYLGSGIWRENKHYQLQNVVLLGDPAAGTSEGIYYKQFSALTKNSRGEIAFLGRLGGLGTYSTNDRGVWSESGDLGIALVARSGEQAEHLPSGVYYERFYGLAKNASGKTVFSSILTGHDVIERNNRGIWSHDRSGEITLIARTGESAPDTPLGANFGSLSNISLNARGQVAFSARLIGPGIDIWNDTGIWAQTPNGTLRLIAREGMQLDVSDDPAIEDLRIVREISTLPTSANENLSSSAFNDRGEFAFRASFLDGTSGIFVSRVVAVPEPAAVLLVVTTLVCYRSSFFHRQRLNRTRSKQ